MGLSGGLASNGKGASSAAVRYARLITVGGSRAQGFSPQDVTGNFGFQRGKIYSDRYPTKLCRLFGSEDLNYGLAGAVGAIDNKSSGVTINQPGGYATAMQACRPKAPQWNQNGAYIDRNSAPYLPQSDLYTFSFGGNDVQWMDTNTSVGSAIAVNATRAMLCMARAGGAWSADHASVTIGAGWNAKVTDFKIAIGGSGAYYTLPFNAAANRTITIVVPADVDATEIDVYVGQFGVHGATYTATLGGNPVTFGAPFNSTTATTGQNFGGKVLTNNVGGVENRYTPTVLRIPYTSTGSTQTIVVSVTPSASAVTGEFPSVFFGWSSMATLPYLPLCVIVGDYNSPAFPITNPTTGVVVTASVAQTHNAALAAMATEFTDGMVRVPDVYTAFASYGTAYGQPGSLFESDNVHLSERGNSYMAQVLFQDISRSPQPLNLTQALVGSPWYRTLGQYGGAYPNGSEISFIAANQANVSTAPVQYRRAGDGMVSLRGAFTLSAYPASNTVLWQLPPGHWPAQGAFFICSCGNSALTSFGNVTLGINNRGEVTYWANSGVAGTGYIDVSGIQFYGDG